MERKEKKETTTYCECGINHWGCDCGTHCDQCGGEITTNQRIEPDDERLHPSLIMTDSDHEAGKMSLDECKNRVAQKYGEPTWDKLWMYIKNESYAVQSKMDEVAELYASQLSPDADLSEIIDKSNKYTKLLQDYDKLRYTFMEVLNQLQDVCESMPNNIIDRQQNIDEWCERAGVPLVNLKIN